MDTITAASNHLRSSLFIAVLAALRKVSLISVCEFYNIFQSHDKLGRVVCTPKMIEAPYNLESGAKLQWYEISGVKKSKGELLAAFELYEVNYIII